MVLLRRGEKVRVCLLPYHPENVTGFASSVNSVLLLARPLLTLT